jgi:hypothetical protein
VRNRRPEAAKVLAELTELASKRFVPPLYLAVIHAGLGDKDAAFELLVAALADRSLPSWYLPDHRLDPLRGDARFNRVLRQMGLPAAR